MKQKNTAKRKTASLPAAVCEQELYDKVTDYAVENGISRSEVVRRALGFYLNRASHFRQRTVASSGTTHKEEGK